MYKIEKGIPIPTHRGENSKYPFFEMDLNDSFEVQVGNTTPEKIAASIRNCYHNICRNNKDFKNKKFTIRVTSNTTVRCWRIK
jgi:hypothetical protein